MVSVDQIEEGEWMVYSPSCEYWSGQWQPGGVRGLIRSEESWIHSSCAISFLFTLSDLLHRLGYHGWLCGQCTTRGQGWQWQTVEE